MLFRRKKKTRSPDRPEASRLLEMESAFLSSVSHSIRTPLSSIIGFAHTLRAAGDAIGPELRAEMLERIERNAHRLNRLIADLIDVDRLARGTLEAYRTETDVAALMRRVASETPGIPQDRISIEAGEVVAMLDAAKLERLIEHLVRNALTVSPPGSPVRLSAIRDDAEVRITVEDEGPGIPDAFKQAIFQPFRQGPGTSHAPGMGVGLSLVAGVARLHGGRVWVQDRPGGGASFRLVLPDPRRSPQVSRSG
jgi:signal transduction histidine kinase